MAMTTEQQLAALTTQLTQMSSMVEKLIRNGQAVSGGLDKTASSIKWATSNLTAAFQEAAKNTEKADTDYNIIADRDIRLYRDYVDGKSRLHSTEKQTNHEFEKERLLELSKMREYGKASVKQAQDNEDNSKKAFKQAIQDRVQTQAAIKAAKAKQTAYLNDTSLTAAEQAEKVGKVDVELVKLNKTLHEAVSASNKANQAHKAAVQVQQDILPKMFGINKALTDQEAKVKSLKIGASLEKASNDIVEKLQGFAKAIPALLIANATAAVYETLKTARVEIKRQGGVGDTSQYQTGQLGVKRSEFAEMAGEYRRTMLAMGGLGESIGNGATAVEKLTAGQKEAFAITGDNAEATKLQVSFYDNLARNGIKPTVDRFKNFAASTKEIQTAWGITAGQFGDMIRDLTDDEASQQALRFANSEEERYNIVKNNQARLEEYKSLGMTSQQALAAAKAMNKMAGEGPMERYKKSMKLQMVMGAMGVSGGAEAAAIYRKNKKNRTKEEEAQLSGHLSNLSNVSSTRMGSDNIGESMVAEQLGNKSGFTDQALADLNTKGLEPLQAALKENTSALQKINNAAVSDWTSMFSKFDAVVNFFTNTPWVQLIGGVVGAGAAIAGGIFMLTSKMGLLTGVMSSLVSIVKSTKIGGLLSNKLGSAGAGGAAGGAGVAAGGAGGAAGNMLGGLGTGIAKFLGSIGKGIAGVGGGIGKAIKLVFDGTASGLTKLSNPKLFIGVAVLTALGTSMWVAGKAMQSFADVGWDDVGKGMTTMAGLGILAAVISGASVPILIGAAAIGVLGASMWVAGKAMQEFAQAFQQFGEVKWGQLGTGLGQFGTGLAELWDKSPNPLKLTALALSIGAVSLAMAGFRAGDGGDGLGKLADNLSTIAAIDPNKLVAVAQAAAKIKDSVTGPSAKTTTDTTTESGTASNSQDKLQKQDNIASQLSKMSEANNYLKSMAENVPKLVDLASKQLVAITLTEAEKTKNRDSIRKDTSFSANSYSYIN